MSVIKPTTAKLTVYYVPETNWLLKHFRPFSRIGILCHLASPIENALRKRACLLEYHPWAGWQVSTDLHRWKKKYKGEDNIPLSSHLTDEQFMEVWDTTLGHNYYRNVRLTPERTIARFLGNIAPWTKATWKGLPLPILK